MYLSIFSRLFLSSIICLFYSEVVSYYSLLPIPDSWYIVSKIKFSAYVSCIVSHLIPKQPAYIFRYVMFLSEDHQIVFILFDDLLIPLVFLSYIGFFQIECIQCTFQYSICYSFYPFRPLY